MAGHWQILAVEYMALSFGEVDSRWAKTNQLQALARLQLIGAPSKRRRNK